MRHPGEEHVDLRRGKRFLFLRPLASMSLLTQIIFILQDVWNCSIKT